MKKSVGTNLILVLVASAAMGQSLGPSGASGSSFAPCTLEADEITQSLDCSLVAETSIVCSGGGVTTDNQFVRRFFLNEDHGIVDAYTVEAVEFGVQSARPGERGGPCPGSPLTVNCYSIPNGQPLRYSNMILRDSSSVNLLGTPELSFVTVWMNGDCRIGHPLSQDLVIEIVSCDHWSSDDGGAFWIGTNDLGEIRPSYIAAPDCAIDEPTTLDDLGFPLSDYVWVIQGREDGLSCTGAFTGEPLVRRRPSGVDIDFSIEITHLHGDATVPIYVELQDLQGTVMAARELGIITLYTGEQLSLSDVLRAPESVPAGTYMLVAKIPRMRRLVQFKKLVQVP